MTGTIIGIGYIAYGIYIFNRGWIRRWEMFPFFGVLGASIIGTTKLYGAGVTVAGLFNIGFGLFCVIGAFVF